MANRQPIRDLFKKLKIEKNKFFSALFVQKLGRGSIPMFYHFNLKTKW